MPQETNLCFDYSTGTVCKGRTECKYKRVRYHRFLDTARVEPNTRTSTITQVVTSIFPQTKPVLTPKQIYDFNPTAYYKTINSQVAQLIMNNFPWGKEAMRIAVFNVATVQTSTQGSGGPGTWRIIDQTVQLPPGIYVGQRVLITGKAAFSKWYNAYAIGITDPGKRWPIVFAHLTENYQNYADEENMAGFALSQMQKLIQQAFSGIIVLNTTP